MTEKQSNLLAKSPNTKKALAVLEKFAKLEQQYKALEKESKTAVELIKQAMIDNNINKIDIDTETLSGYITLAERTSYKANLDELDEKYTKPTLDTDKVKAEAVLTGMLPAGVIETKTQYITKKINVKE